MRLLINWAIRPKEISALIIPSRSFTPNVVDNTRKNGSRFAGFISYNRLSFSPLPPPLPFLIFYLSQNRDYRERIHHGIYLRCIVHSLATATTPRCILSTPSRGLVRRATIFRNARRETIYLRGEYVVKELLRHSPLLDSTRSILSSLSDIFRILFAHILLSLRKRGMVL